MVKKNTIFDFLTNVMVIFAITVISIGFFTFLFGNEAERISSFFALGERGIPLTVLVQLFVMSLMISTLKWVLFSDALIKSLSLALRTILMFVAIIILIAVFAAVFRWFPVNKITPWIMFFICFAVFATVSTLISIVKEKSENKKLQDALERLKQEDRSCQV